MKLDEDFTDEEIKDILDKDSVSFPQIVFEGKNVGGLVDAAKLFQSRGLV
jgi:glutaredoxin